jgi:hypothetical protein
MNTDVFVMIVILIATRTYTTWLESPFDPAPRIPNLFVKLADKATSIV